MFGRSASGASARGLVSTASLALAFALGGCGDLEGPQQTSRVTGTIEIADVTAMGVGIKTRSFSCYGLREYTDLHEDARVTIEDDSGNDVSTGKLGQGRPVYEPRDLEQGAKAEPQSCVLGFVVEGVPPVGRSWSVRIGRYRFDLPPDRTSNLALSLG